MPCDSVVTQSVNLANAMRDLVAEALKEQGYQIDSTSSETHIWAYKPGSESIIWRKGQGLMVQRQGGSRRQREAMEVKNQAAVNALTVAYSKTCVTWAAQRAGWQVKQTGANTLTVTRR